ncbi:cobalamin B12-binding domain-containing protein [Kitasatospora sp. NPDC004531]
MATVDRAAPRVLLSTVSSDAHTWNLVFLQLLLEEHGFQVVNLGPCVPDELLLDSVREHRPDLVVISTVNGHGKLDGGRVIRLLRAQPDLADVPVVIGGKLGIAGADDAGSRELVEAGFTAVFTDAVDAAALPGRLGRLLPAGASA